MTARAGHACRTDIERAACEEMSRQSLPHAHRSLHFRVAGPKGRAAQYAPAIVAHRGPILFLVEPVRSAEDTRSIERLRRFLDQHSPDIVLAVVTADASVDRMPHEAYDEIYGVSALPQLVGRIRDQDPQGIVLPFEKPRRL